MRYRTQIDRRAFIVSAAAATGGLALGLEIPFGGGGMATAQAASPEVNAWVVIHPDDTVVIRIARSEMGQGTLTGLAQLVAEELDCDWSKVTTEYPTPGQNVARKRVWGDFSTGGSRGIRTSHEYVRQGGAAARMMLIQAAADEWEVAAAECTAENSVISHKPSARTTTFGKVASAAVKLNPPTEIKLKDPKDWKIAGKPLKRLDTADKTTGKMMYGIDFRLPGMLNAAVKACPVFGGKVKSFDAAKVAGMKGDRPRCFAHFLGRGTERESLQRLHRRDPQSRARRGAGIRRQSSRRYPRRPCRCREEGRGGLLLSLSEPCRDGAAERDGALCGGQVRGLVRNPERRGRIRRYALRLRFTR